MTVWTEPDKYPLPQIQCFPFSSFLYKQHEAALLWIHAVNCRDLHGYVWIMDHTWPVKDSDVGCWSFKCGNRSGYNLYILLSPHRISTSENIRKKEVQPCLLDLQELLTVIYSESINGLYWGLTHRCYVRKGVTYTWNNDSHQGHHILSCQTMWPCRGYMLYFFWCVCVCLLYIWTVMRNTECLCCRQSNEPTYDYVIWILDPFHAISGH